MAVDTIARAASTGAALKITHLNEGLQDGSIIAGRTFADENYVNIYDDYARKAELPYIAADVFPYTDTELASLLGILFCSDLVLCSEITICT